MSWCLEHFCFPRFLRSENCGKQECGSCRLFGLNRIKNDVG